MNRVEDLERAGFALAAARAHGRVAGGILRQIDGALDVNQNTGKWRLKLISPDFDPNATPHITKDNCSIEPPTRTRTGAIVRPR